MFGKRLRRVALGVGSAVGISTALLASPASASVVPVNTVKLCTGANYSAFVLFDDRGELTSTVVTPNDCWRHSFSSAGEAEKIEFRGIWNTHPSESFLIYSTKIDLSNSGIGVTVKGTTTDPTYTVW